MGLRDKTVALIKPSKDLGIHNTQCKTSNPPKESKSPNSKEIFTNLSSTHSGKISVFALFPVLFMSISRAYRNGLLGME